MVIPDTEFASGGHLYGYWSSATSRTDAEKMSTEPTAPVPNTVASDIDDDVHAKFRIGPANPFDNAVLSGLVTLGPGPVEPSGEDEGGFGQGKPDLQANMTVDFGFYTITLGDLVWNDANNDGLTLSETGLGSVDVQLWSKNGSLPLTTTTNGAGNYAFTGLPAGNYYVWHFRHSVQSCSCSSSSRHAARLRLQHSRLPGPYPYEPGRDVDTVAINDDDNGTAVGVTPDQDGTYNSSLELGGYVQSSVFALTPGAEDAASSNNLLGLTSEPRVDFGLFTNVQTDLAVTKTDGVNIYIPGGTLNYTITVTNKGPKRCHQRAS